MEENSKIVSEYLQSNLPPLSFQPSKALLQFIPSSLLPSLNIMTFKDKQTVYEPGDETEAVYYILEGRVRLTVGRISKKKSPKKSVILSNTYFGDHEVLQSKRRVHTVTVQSPTATLLIIPKSHSHSLRFLKKQSSTIFEQLNSQLTYELIPKLMRAKPFVKGQTFNSKQHPIGIILSGQFTVKRSITFLKEDFSNHLYEFNKVLPVMTFVSKQTVLWDCTCVSALAEVMVITSEDYLQIIGMDQRLGRNVGKMREMFGRVLDEREGELKKTLESRNIEQSLGLSVHFKTEPNLEEIEEELPIHPNICNSDKTKLIKLRRQIIAKSKQPKLPRIMQNVLFRLPIKRTEFLSVQRKIQQAEQRLIQKPQLTFLSNEFHRLFQTPEYLTKFSMKMFTRLEGDKKAGGYFSPKQLRDCSCRKRRSLVLIPN